MLAVYHNPIRPIFPHRLSQEWSSTPSSSPALPSDSIITSITWLLYPSASIVSLCVPTGNSDVSMVISVSFTVVSSSSSPYLTKVIAFRYSALPFSVHSFPRWILSCPVSFGASLSSAGGIDFGTIFQNISAICCSLRQ